MKTQGVLFRSLEPATVVPYKLTEKQIDRLKRRINNTVEARYGCRCGGEYWIIYRNRLQCCFCEAVYMVEALHPSTFTLNRTHYAEEK